VGKGRNERPSDRRVAAGTRRRAWRNLAFYDEHTWGADTSVSVPDSDDTRTQWNHKANYAHTARSNSNAVRRDAVAEIARHVVQSETDTEASGGASDGSNREEER
jgi:hypothetical protein